jgi:hypothetical protein
MYERIIDMFTFTISHGACIRDFEGALERLHTAVLGDSRPQVLDESRQVWARFTFSIRSVITEIQVNKAFILLSGDQQLQGLLGSS